MSSAADAPAAGGWVPREVAAVHSQIVQYRSETWHWERVMSIGLTPSSNGVRRVRSMSYKRWVRDLWKQRARAAKRRAQNPPHKRAWLCLQRHEGRWDDPNPPYYGGLQMDLTFQRTYGARLLRRKGTADRWTPIEQMWVGERALRAGRGFWPWPNSARACGLI